MEIKKGSRIKIKSGDSAGRIGVCVAQVPGAATVWNVALPGKGQVRVDEKDMEPASAE